LPELLLYKDGNNTGAMGTKGKIKDAKTI
jgi:hypothetical protein